MASCVGVAEMRKWGLEELGTGVWGVSVGGVGGWGLRRGEELKTTRKTK